MEKNTGVTRRVDELGRIVIPIDIRNKFNIKEKDLIEIYVEKDCIILKKYEESCIFCGNKEALKKYLNQFICEKCCKNIINKY